MSLAENFQIFQNFHIFLTKKGCTTKLNAKFWLNPITSCFVLFSIPEEKGYLCHWKMENFQNFQVFCFCKMEFGNEKGMPKRKLNAKFQLNPITSYFLQFSIREEIAIHNTRREISSFSNIFKILKNICLFCKMSLGM